MLNKKILITGGHGLVGKYLQNHMDGIFLSSKDCDLRNENAVKKIFQKYKPDIVIHLAAKVGGIMDNINNPIDYFEDNVLMNSMILKYSRLYGVNKFLTLLSSCIYPDVATTYPLKETELHNGLPNETNFGYAYSKRMLGLQVDLLKKHGHNYSYIIPSNLYGMYEHGSVDRKHFIGAILDKIKLANEKNQNFIELYGDGSPLRQFTYADDLAKIIYLVINNNIKENFNFSYPKNLSIDEIANICLKVTNNKSIQIKYDKTKPNGQIRKDIDLNTFNKLFPNFNFTTLDSGINKVWHFYNEK